MSTPAPFPDFLPLLPPVPLGFDRWIYRGIKYASPRAIMVTSWDETEDSDWDPVHMFQTRGDDNTHYAEAVINHHEICTCAECRPRCAACDRGDFQLGHSDECPKSKAQ